MLTPDYLAKVADGSEQIASDLHEYMIKKIVDRMMARLGRGEDYIFSASDKWQINILQDAGYLLEDITAELAKYTKRQQTEVKAAMEEAGVKALEADAAIYEAAGLSPLPLWESPQLVRLMERNYEKTLGEWQNYTGTTAKAAQQLFINECDKAYNRVVSGATTYNVAVKEALQEIVHDGVYVKYPSGHRDTIETATARAVRTGIAQATADIQLARMREMGYDLVLTSSHMGSRPSHETWQGQVFHIDWDKMAQIKPYMKEGG